MRTIGSHNAWDDVGWDGGDDGGSTWSPGITFSDLSTLVASDPSSSAGVSVGSRASGGLRLIVEMLNPTVSSSGSLASAWDTAVWDTDGWAASAGAWVDITSRVRGLNWTFGQHDPLGRADVATADVTLDNRDGALSPWAIAGAFAAGGVSWLQAGVLVRWGIYRTTTLAAGLPALPSYTALFTGRIESVGEGTQDGVDAWVPLTLVDTLTDLASVPADYELVAQSAAGAIYDLAFAGGWTFQADTMEVPDTDVAVVDTVFSGKSTIERLQVIADCAHWDVITDGRGRLKVIPRKLAESASGLTFSNAPTAGQMPLAVDSVTPYSSTDRVINVAVAAGVSTGVNQTAVSASSVSAFGSIGNRFGFPRTDLPLADADVLALVQKVVRLRALDNLGISQIEINGDLDLVNYPAVLTYLASTGKGGVSFVVKWKHPSGNVFTRTLIAEGQKHSVTMEGTTLLWTATIQTASA